MLDERHVSDTLFLVLEEDFRLRRPKEEPIALHPQGTAPTGGVAGGPQGAAGSSCVLTPAEEKEKKVLNLQAGWEERVGVPGDYKIISEGTPSAELAAFHTRPTKAITKEHEENMSEDLLHLVRLCTAAHRKNLGDIVWFSWNHDEKMPKGSPSPLYGSTGIAVTIPGAKWIQEEMPKMKVWHWDMVLKQQLEEGQAKASYIFPAVRVCVCVV